MKNITILLLTLFLLSCTTIKKEKLVGCEHFSGWCDQIRETADDAFIYAQMASNTYKDNYKFRLPANYELILEKDNDDIGFAYSLYENKSENLIVISFRGTEGLNFKDWWYGNIWADQNDEGLKLFDELKESYSDKTKFIVTGHSLGGGIAMEVSLKRENAPVYAFNTSPRFRADGYNIKNKRVSIIENGEVLRIPRAPAKEATQTYTSIGCNSGNGISQHEQVKLATCLTQIAATQSTLAKQSLLDNNIKDRFGSN